MGISDHKGMAARGVREYNLGSSHPDCRSSIISRVVFKLSKPGSSFSAVCMKGRGRMGLTGLTPFRQRFCTLAKSRL